MSYNKLNFVNGQTPAISASNLNHMDQGIADAHAGLADTYTKDEVDETIGEINATLEEVVEKVSFNKIVKISGTAQEVTARSATSITKTAENLAALGIDDVTKIAVISVAQKLQNDSYKHLGTYRCWTAGEDEMKQTFPAAYANTSSGTLVIRLLNHETTDLDISYEVYLMVF